MKRYEILVAFLLILSTSMKIGSLVALCHISHHLDETAHEQHLCVEKKKQASHQPLGK
jgi:hypothetical protein